MKLPAIVFLCAILQCLFLGGHSTLVLKQVQFLTRHGDRTPINNVNSPKLKDHLWDCGASVKYESIFYPQSTPGTNDRAFFKKYTTISDPMSNCPAGSLTLMGVQQHVELGQQMRRRYVDTENATMRLLSPKDLDTTQVLIESSDVPRTILSAQSFWQGMYPTPTSARQTVNLYTTDQASSDMYINNDLCPRLTELAEQIVNKKQYQEYIAREVKPLVEAFASALNIPVSSALSYWPGLYDVFECRSSHQVPLPTGITSQMVQQLSATGSWRWAQYMNSTAPLSLQYTMLGIGRLLAKIKNRIKDYIQGKPNSWKWVHYSGHDSTLFPMREILFISDHIIPHFASHLAFELYQDDSNGEYHVSIVYNGKQATMPGLVDSVKRVINL